jgi:hypothetical protein
MNKIAEIVWEFEKDISGEEEVEEFREDIEELTTWDEVVEYYESERGWGDDRDLMSDLAWFLASELQSRE